MRLSACFVGLALLLASDLSAQHGGESKTIHRFQGTGRGDARGVGHALGDVDGDGIEDFGLTRTVAWAGAMDVFSGATATLLYSIPTLPLEDAFGRNLAKLGDVDGDGLDDYVVTAQIADGPVFSTTGAIYAFSGSDGSLLYDVQGPVDRGRLGEVISSGFDVDGDGVYEILVSNDGEYAAPIGFSSVYLLSGATGVELHRFDGAIDEEAFGAGLAFVPDRDGDGLEDIAIGRPFDQSVTSGEGVVEIYSSSTFASLVRIQGTGLFSRFGYGIQPGHDFDGDGVRDLLVRAPWERDANGDAPGMVWVISGADDSALLLLSGRSAGSQFGLEMASVHDVDGDQVPDYLIGSHHGDPGGHWQAGEAFLFSGVTGQVLHRFEGRFNHDELGRTVDGLGDLDGDGYGEVLIGIPGADPPGAPLGGEVSIHSFLPFLTSDRYEVSASAGGDLNLDLAFPMVAAGQDYLCLISLAGTGSLQYGTTIPLRMDPYLLDSSNGNYPFASHSGMHGTLDALGQGSASVNFPAGFASQAIGHTFWVAAVTYPAGQLPNFSSVAIPVTILP